MGIALEKDLWDWNRKGENSPPISLHFCRSWKWKISISLKWLNFKCLYSQQPYFLPNHPVFRCCFLPGIVLCSTAPRILQFYHRWKSQLKVSSQFFFFFFFSSDVQCSCCLVNRWIFSGRNTDPFRFIKRERLRQGMISEHRHILPWFLRPAVCLSRLLSLCLTFLLFICHFCPSANTLWWHFEKLWHSPSI